MPSWEKTKLPKKKNSGWFCETGVFLEMLRDPRNVGRSLHPEGLEVYIRGTPFLKNYLDII